MFACCSSSSSSSKLSLLQTATRTSAHVILVLQVVIIADEVDAISAEVRAASDAFEIVVTAGGVGPTRDDVTMAGVAEALGKPLLRSASALASL